MPFFDDDGPFQKAMVTAAEWINELYISFEKIWDSSKGWWENIQAIWDKIWKELTTLGETFWENHGEKITEWLATAKDELKAIIVDIGTWIADAVKERFVTAFPMLSKAMGIEGTSSGGQAAQKESTSQLRAGYEQFTSPSKMYESSPWGLKTAGGALGAAGWGADKVGQGITGAYNWLMDDVKEVLQAGFVPLSKNDLVIDKQSLGSAVGGGKGSAIPNLLSAMGQGGGGSTSIEVTVKITGDMLSDQAIQSIAKKAVIQGIVASGKHSLGVTDYEGSR